MDNEIKSQLEEATQMAFNQYAERHPSLAAFLESNRQQLLATAVESIKDDPEVKKALALARTEGDLQKLVRLAEAYLPKLIGIL